MICSGCGEDKDESCFYSGKVCKDCKKKRRKSRAGCPKTSAYNKEYAKKRTYEYTPERREYARKRYEAKKDHICEIQKSYRENNLAGHRLRQAKRRARKLSATPPWLSDEQKAHIKRTYKLAALMEEITGVKYHVDHIIPLQGKDICGLHVPNNLQVLRADLNLSKSNLHKD